MRKVFIEELPVWKSGINKGKINWNDSKNAKVPFVYEDEKGYITIVEYIKGKHPKVKIKYNGKEYDIYTDSFLRCSLGRILDKRTKEFKVEIGTIIQDQTRDITIIDKEYRKDNYSCNRKYYKYHCNKCTAELWMLETFLLKGTNCACCTNQVVVKGINDIATTNEKLIKFFVNTEDVYSHTVGSGKKVLVKCPDCDSKKLMIIKDLYNQGFSCSKCSDGISYPEKLMYNVLEQLGVNFIPQYNKLNSEWCQSFKYDFYFEYCGEKFIVEAHGEQHYIENTSFKKSLAEQQQNDRDKMELALNNNIDHYIVVDCRYSNLEYIKNNILKSKLNSLFDLRIIDWNNCLYYATSSLVKVASKYKNESADITTFEIAKKMKYHKTTIRRWLKLGNELGLCHYDAKEETEKIRKEVSVFRNGEFIKKFPSSRELEKESKRLFGCKFRQGKVSLVCNGKKPQYKGYTFKYTGDMN